MVICSNMKCKNIDDIEGDFCPDCGSETVESDSTLIFAKQNFPTELSVSSSKFSSFKADPNSPRAKSEQKENDKLLYYDSMQNGEIQNKIKEDMKNLDGHEGGSKWMRIGTLLTLNPTDQIDRCSLKHLLIRTKFLFVKMN